MNWYIAKIVFSINSGDGQHTPQFDEQLRLIAARNSEEAFSKARVIGSCEEETFVNDKKKSVKWQFIDVADLIPLQELKDGIEVYSSIRETDEAGPYINYVQQKAAVIQTMPLFRTS